MNSETQQKLDTLLNLDLPELETFDIGLSSSELSYFSLSQEEY